MKATVTGSYPKRPGWLPGALLATWCALAIFLAWRGTFPNPYLLHVRHVTAPQPYPFLLVGSELVVSGMALALLGWALLAQSWERIWRTFLCGFMAGSIGLTMLSGAMHMPDHFIYCGLSIIAIAALSIALGVAFLVIEITRKAPER